MINVFLQPQVMAAFSKEDILKFIKTTQSVGLEGGKDILSTIGKLNDNGGPITQAIQKILNIVSPIAFAMLMVYFAIGIIEDAHLKGGEIDMKSFVKAGIGLIVGTIFIQAAPHIVGRMMALNDAMVSVGGTLGTLDTTIRENKDNMSSYNIITLLFLACMSVVSVIPQLIALLVLTITIFSAKIEVALRLGFAPIGLAGFASDSGRQNAIRYFRKLVASMLYMFGIAIVIYLTTQLQLGDLGLVNAPSDGGNFLIKWLLNLEKGILLLAVPFAAIGAITAMKGVINEALGA